MQAVQFPPLRGSGSLPSLSNVKGESRAWEQVAQGTYGQAATEAGI